MGEYVGLLILSLGGSPEPAVYSIKKHRPRQVHFFVSEQSATLVETVLKAAGFRGKVDVTTMRDPEDLSACFLVAKDLVDAIGAARRPGTVIDLTGGTKVMVAALALAAYGKNRAFFLRRRCRPVER